MKILITFGPAYAPIDGVRRITNRSTGSLGAFLCDQFATLKHEVTGFRGEMAVNLPPSRIRNLHSFSTNQSLLALLEEETLRGPVEAIFHLAALCDYELDHLEDTSGKSVKTDGKIKSHHDSLRLMLKKAPKILPRLRSLFPSAKIIGWKYELDGARDAAFALGQQQVRDCRTDLCVVNGKGYGKGYGICNGTEILAQLEHPGDLLKWLSSFLDNPRF